MSFIFKQSVHVADKHKKVTKKILVLPAVPGATEEWAALNSVWLL